MIYLLYYLLLKAIASLKLEPHVHISGLEVNGEPWKGETLSVTVFLNGGNKARNRRVLQYPR
jgi:hypothetical protein